MTIKFTIPDEYLAATKQRIGMLNPTSGDPTDADVLAFVSDFIVNAMSGMFPNVTLASQSAAREQMATAQAAMKQATITALGVGIV
jgi:hypothetical protein